MRDGRSLRFQFAVWGQVRDLLGSSSMSAQGRGTKILFQLQKILKGMSVLVIKYKRIKITININNKNNSFLY